MSNITVRPVDDKTFEVTVSGLAATTHTVTVQRGHAERVYRRQGSSGTTRLWCVRGDLGKGEAIQGRGSSWCSRRYLLAWRVKSA